MANGNGNGGIATFVKKYWSAVSAIISVIVFTASFLFWMDARYVAVDEHARIVCELRNDLLILSNGLSKVILKEESDRIREAIVKLDGQEGHTSADRAELARLQNDLKRFQTLLVKVEGADLGEIKHVCG